MSKFSKKRGNTSPGISTASLPDIVFMLLFFFMVVTVMKNADMMVEVSVPEASELKKIKDKSLATYYYIGKPLPQFQEQWGTKPRLQLDDKFAELEDIPMFVQRKKDSVIEEKKDQLVASLRIDGEVTMGFVTDVKTELRKAGQLKVNYAGRERAKDLE